MLTTSPQLQLHETLSFTTAQNTLKCGTTSCRQLVDEGHVSPKYLPTGDQIADVLTKGLSREKHEKFTQAMGLTAVT